MEWYIAGIFGSSGKFTKKHFIISMQKVFKEMSNFIPVSVSLIHFSFFIVTKRSIAKKENFMSCTTFALEESMLSLLHYMKDCL